MTAYVIVGYRNGISARLYFNPLRNPEFGEISPLIDEVFSKLIELCSGAIDVDFGRLRWRVANAIQKSK